MPTWTSFVALGDSFTEGMDDLRPDGSYGGWADLVAAALSARTPGFRYANLAIRGRMLGQIVDEQVPRALELQPALVSLTGGVNDIMRPGVDVGRLVKTFDDAVRRLRTGGSEVVLFGGADPSRRGGLMKVLTARAAALSAGVERAAADYDCNLVRVWESTILYDSRMWSADRLHLSALGHRRVAAAVLEALGVGDAEWREPLPPVPRLPWSAARRNDVVWVRRHFGPWIGRRVTGKSSGDGISPKHPDLISLEEERA